MNSFPDVPMPPPRRAQSFRRTGRRFLFSIVFFVPFFFLPATDDPQNINKLVLVGLLALSALVCGLSCVLIERHVKYPRSWTALSAGVFLVIVALSAWLSLSHSLSFSGNLSAPDSVLSWAVYVLVFLLTFFFFERTDIPKIGIAAGSGLLMGALMGFLQIRGIFIFPWQFAQSVNFNPAGSVTAWGILAAAAIAALMVVRPGELTYRRKILFFAAVGIAFLSLIVVNDPMLWLVLAAFVAILAALRFGPREHFQYAFAAIVLALLFALVGPRLAAFGFPSDQNSGPDISATIITTGRTLAGPRAILGSGPATFAFDFAAFRPVAVNQTGYWSGTFSEGQDLALTLLATTGLLGFFLFLWFVFLAIQPFLHIQLLDTDLAMVSSAAAFLLVMLFFAPASFAGLTILFVLLGVLMNAGGARKKISFESLGSANSFLFSLAAIVLITASLAGVFLIGEQYAAAVLFAQASDLSSSGNLSGAFSKVNTAIGLDRSDIYLRGASGILLSEVRVLVSATGTAATDELPSVITNAVRSGIAATVADPNDPANWGNLGMVDEALMQFVSGADQSAVASYQKAADLDPVDPRWDIATARTLMESADLLSVDPANDNARQAERDQAESFLEKAIALKNDYAASRVLLVQLYLQEGNMAQAIAKVQELKQQNPLDPGVAFELGYLYYQDNQTDNAAEEFQVAIILSPHYANARYFLGLIYDQKGMTAQALDEFQRIAADNPGNDQVAQIIANIQAGRPALENVNAPAALTGSEPQTSIPTTTTPAASSGKGQ